MLPGASVKSPGKLDLAPASTIVDHPNGMDERVRESTGRVKLAALLRLACWGSAFLSPLIPAITNAGPIYVIEERDGTVRFTNKPPSEGVQAKVFTARSGQFSWYRTGRRGSDRLNLTDYRSVTKSVAARFGLDEALVRAVIHVESGFQRTARSPKGAEGLMQLMPGTQQLLGVKDPWDPEQNIEGGARYLTMMLDRFDGKLELALAGYNAGPENVERYRGIPPFRETKEYVDRVNKLVSRYHHGLTPGSPPDTGKIR